MWEITISSNRGRIKRTTNEIATRGIFVGLTKRFGYDAPPVRFEEVFGKGRLRVDFSCTPINESISKVDCQLEFSPEALNSLPVGITKFIPLPNTTYPSFTAILADGYSATLSEALGLVLREDSYSYVGDRSLTTSNQ